MQVLDAYNVFRRREKPALRCAVRQDRPVPNFIRGDAWEFAGIAHTADPPAGFKSRAAREATSRAGYYLFYALNS
ncbi:hypothetical protein [Methylobacterium nodulans]|uniref:Uncharacterized protein n=1 Tax=Methylobacterium nodulans (strain LMG 21967 / CNCM I-2342 / ORS 2060) TaxID=460265 RepID=B8IHL9_METNO|nr:hypothetical protein [Methylobacterium nodulans]ACL61682.1 conserved hypothetical protein [Methylobacterium nodulans ORS 2060]